MASTDTDETIKDTGESTASSSHSLTSIDGSSDSPSEDCSSSSCDSQIRSYTPIDPIAATAPISVQRLLRSILTKGTSRLAKEFKDTKRVVGKDQSHSKFRLVNASIWKTVWKEKSDFIVHMDNERGSEAMRVGKVLKFKKFSVECIFYHTVAPFVFLKHKIVEKSTGQCHEVAYIRWKGRDPICLRRLTTVIDNLRLSGRAVLISSAKKEDGRAGTFALAAMAIEKLRGGDSLEGGLKPLLRKLDNHDMSARQYVFVHRFILENFKADIDEKKMTQFRSDHAAFHNATGNIFLCTHGNTAYDYYEETNNKDVRFGCKCFLWSKIPGIEKPIDRGPTTVTVIADFSIENSELVVGCERRGDCMDADYIPLKKIVAKFHELGRDIILIVMGEGPAEFDLANLATSRVAVVAAMKKEEEEETDSDDDEDKKPKTYNRLQITIMKILESFSSHREAIECIHNEKELRKNKKMWKEHGSIWGSATFKADIHVDWRKRRDESTTQVESVQEDQPPITPSKAEFRKLLESIQSTDSEQRLDAESKWRRIPGEEKKDLLLKMSKSKNKEVRRLAFERLNMLLNCIACHWGEKKMTHFAKEIIAAALTEKSSMVGRKIAEVLALVADFPGDYERTTCKILNFVLGRKRSDGKVVKTIALEVAAAVLYLGMHKCSGCGRRRSCDNEYKELFEKMIDDETMRSKAIELWARCICNRFYQREENCWVTYEFGNAIQKIIKMCEGNRSTEKGAPLWALIKVLPFVELDEDRCDDDSFETAARCLIEAASRESDEEALEHIVEAIKCVISDKIWPDVVKLIHRCCSTNKKSLKKVALDILAQVDIGDRTEDEIFDFGDDSLAITLIESIEKCFWGVPKRTRSKAFLNVASRFEDKPMECIDRVFLMCIQAAMKDKDELGFLIGLSHEIPKLMQTHFDAVMDAFRVHADAHTNISFSNVLNDIMSDVPGKLEDTKILQKYVNDPNKEIREAAMFNCQTLINGNQERDDFLAQLSFYVTRLIQNTHEDPAEEDTLFSAANELPLVLLAPHAEEITKMAIEAMPNLEEESKRLAVTIFPRLLSSMDSKEGVEATRSLWLIQWNALKRILEEDTQNEFSLVVLKSITECLLVIGRKGVNDEEIKKIIWEIKDQLDKVMSRTKEAREGRQRWSTEHHTTLCAIKIGSNLIQLDPDFAFNYYHQSITSLLHESFNGIIFKGHAVSAVATMAEANHTQWAAVAVAAIEPLCDLVRCENIDYFPKGVKQNPIWAVMQIVKHYGDSIDSEKIRLILASFLTWLPHLKDKKEGHRVFGFLAGLIEAHHDSVIGEPNEKCLKLLTILLQAINGDLFFSTEESQVVKARLIVIVETMNEIAIECVQSLDWNAMEEALAAFPLLLELAGKRGPEAIGSLWATQWNALKRVIEENTKRELDSTVIKTLTECLLEVGRKGVTGDEMNEIASTIKDKLEELFSRERKRKREENDKAVYRLRLTTHKTDTNRIMTIKIATNLIKFDPEFALHHHKSITQLLSQSLADDDSSRQDCAVAAYAIVAEANHTQWAAVAVEAIEPLCSIAASRNNRFSPNAAGWAVIIRAPEPENFKDTPICAVLTIVKHCGNSIDSEKIRLVLASLVSYLPYVNYEKEGLLVFDFLAGLIEDHYDTLLGEPSETGTKLLMMLLEVLNGGQFIFSSEEAQAVKARLVAIVEKINTSGRYTEVFADWKHAEKEKAKSSSASNESTGHGLPAN